MRSFQTLQWRCRPDSSGKGFQNYPGSAGTALAKLRAMLKLPYITGRWPVKSAKFLLSLLKNAESNAITNELASEELVVRNIMVQQAPVITASLSKSFCVLIDCYARKPAVVLTELMDASILTRDTRATLRYPNDLKRTFSLLTSLS